MIRKFPIILNEHGETHAIVLSLKRKVIIVVNNGRGYCCQVKVVSIKMAGESLLSMRYIAAILRGWAGVRSRTLLR